MSTPLLTTKLYIPPPRPKAVVRPRLIERLNDGLHHKLSLVSAPAGFGKTTLVSEWVSGCDRPIAWLSLDEGDNDPARFLTYLVAAIQRIDPSIGVGVAGALQSPQPPPLDAILTALVNDISNITENFALVLDDYHVIDSKLVDNAVAFLVEHLPPQMHLVIATREDPQLPIARLRARGQLTELRVADLRFTPAEAAGFLNQGMGLTLSAADIAALETRTEGWIAGLQLAAISMQGHQDTSAFIKSFTGSHRFVLDYLAEEVLHRQPENVQTFLLQTSVLDRLCGSLCDALLEESAVSGQETLAYLERANLFIIPLDNERRWYRYHHLFGDLLRQRLQQNAPAADLSDLHRRASLWYEANHFYADAFQHAVASRDIDLAARLVEGGGMPLPFRGVVQPVLHWLATLPTAELDGRPVLWVIYASTLLFAAQLGGVEQKLLAAEAAFQNFELDDNIRDQIGHIASIRAAMAVAHDDVETILTQSLRALEYLHPNNVPIRTATTWTLGHAYLLQGKLAESKKLLTEALTVSQMIGHGIIILATTLGLGAIHELENQPQTASHYYQRAIELAGDPPLPISCGAHLGLARLFFQSGDLDSALLHAELALHLARQLDTTNRAAGAEAFLAQVKQAQTPKITPRTGHPSLVESLSERELEVLGLVAQGLSNEDISAKLFLALSTVKGHNQRIFGKLQVQRRTEAIARARDLGLL